MKNIFKGKKPSIEEIPGKLPESYDIVKSIAEKIKSEGVGRVGAPYGGELTAGLTPTEESYYTRLLEGLETSPTTSELYAPARSALMDIITGRWLTEESPVYQQLRRKLWEEEYPEAVAKMRHGFSIGGAFSSRAREEEERELLSDVLNKLADIRAQELMRERERQALAIEPALRLAQWETAEPVERLSRALQLADIERQLRQSELTARYQDWLRQQQEYYNLLPFYLQAGTTPGLGLPTYQYSPGEPSVFSRYIAPAILGGLTGGLGGFLGGGLAGTLGGALLGGLSQGQALPLLTLGNFLGNLGSSLGPIGGFQPGSTYTYYGPGAWGVTTPLPLR